MILVFGTLTYNKIINVIEEPKQVKAKHIDEEENLINENTSPNLSAKT